MSYVQGFEAELSELTKVDVKPVTIKPCDNRCCITLFARLKDPYNIPKKLKLEISLAAPIDHRVLHTLARYSCTSRRCWIEGPVLIIETSPAFHILKRKKNFSSVGGLRVGHHPPRHLVLQDQQHYCTSGHNVHGGGYIYLQILVLV
jgi:hypothetical protein